MNCSNLQIEDINNIFSKVLYEFPVERIAIKFPKWIDGLDFTHPLKAKLFEQMQNMTMGQIVGYAKNVEFFDNKDI